MNKFVQIAFTATQADGTCPEGLFVRALPIYAVPAHLSDPVKRCPNHASPSDSSNLDFPQVIQIKI